MQQQNDSSQTVRVDVRLCGSIPRKDMKEHLLTENGARCSLTSLNVSPLNTRCLAAANGPTSDHSTHRTIPTCGAISGLVAANDHNINMPSTTATLYPTMPLAPLMEPPAWAVAARGESRLEPVCDSLGRQSAVDLTRQSSFRVGRSPNSDVQLHHATSSRRHAMLFHHSNGSCYVVDCGSAHGTFVNGNRISGPADAGVVIPQKVRRGALVRFGGPGAPTFIMKSFSFRLQDIDTKTSSDLVRRNTRLNALGKTAAESVRCGVSCNIQEAIDVCRKRSFDSIDTNFTLDEPSMKRIRCSSPPLSPEAPLRLVSPDLISMTASKRRRVAFSADPPRAFYPAMVTPEVLSGQEDN